jgi:ankyrin repeat protein
LNLELLVGLGHQALVEYLLTHSADTSAVNSIGELALHYAVRERSNSVEILQQLIAAGASVTFRHDNDDTPLHQAVRENALTMAEVLILAGADVNARCFFSHTALHIAADEGMLEMSRLLLKYNADPSAVEDRGCTPADMAEDAGHAELTEILKCRS